MLPFETRFSCLRTSNSQGFEQFHAYFLNLPAVTLLELLEGFEEPVGLREAKRTDHDPDRIEVPVSAKGSERQDRQ